ncbi:MAG: hypothetical protein A3F11_08865 [Gammaproteobacteria bacterium RIFCSPHIGHO2_12_FULL_37_14]|nr:MAG: hypothetical protein A3F11_08865 [Gammaproteobacteria bacterium RIFCSPHIGHO2_12_FULL_37_14]
MRKLIAIFIFFIIHIQSIYAETCPSISDIKKGKLHTWQLHDSESHQLLSAKHLEQFKKYAQQFTLAEWHKNNNQQNSLRCYYRDWNGSEARAYLAKNNFRPHLAKNSWYSVSGSMHCAAGLKNCTFQHTKPSPQLARNGK